MMKHILLLAFLLGGLTTLSSANGFSTETLVCEIPTGLSTTNITQTTAQFNWSAVSGAGSYRVNWHVVGTGTWQTALVQAPLTTYAVTGLTANTNYEWKVKTLCTNGGGESDFSPPLAFTTLAPPVCEVPTGLSTTNITSTTAKFNWNAVAGAGYYRVAYHATPNGAWTYQIVQGATMYMATGLAAATAYEWKVQAQCTNGALSDYSPPLAFTTLGANCDVPTDLSTTDITAISAKFNWTAVAGAASYRVNYHVVGNQNWITVVVNAPNTSFTANGLTPSTNYEWKVKALCSNGGESDFSPVQPFTTLAPPSCDTPTNLSTTNITQTSAQFNWSPVSNYAYYRVMWRATPNGAWTTVVVQSGPMYTVTGLSPNTNYEWKVQTICTNGGESPYSPTQPFTTLGAPTCEIPTGLTTTNITSTSAKFSWNAVGGAASYRVNYHIVGAGTWISVVVNAPTTMFTAQQLTPNTNYEWKVKTLCANGGESDFSPVQPFTTLAPPVCEIPTGLTTTNITHNSAKFNWNAVSGAASYRVNYHVVGNANWISVVVNAPTTMFTANGLTPSTNYEWKVKTLCTNGGESDFSPVQPFMTLAPPACAIPTDLSTTNISQTSAKFNWSAVSGAAYYRVTWHVVGAANWLTAVVQAPNTMYTAQQLTPNTNYEWKVKTICTNGGESDYSPAQPFMTLPVPPCSVPTGLSTTNITQTSAKFNWTAVSGAASYRVNYHVVGAGTWISVLVNAPTVMYTATGLTPNTNYEWKVKTLCTGGGESDFSPVQSFTTLAPPACDVPTNLTTTNITTTSAKFNWSAVSGAAYYRVLWHSVPNGTNQTAIVQAPTTMFTANNLSPNTTYEWTVKTICSNGGESAYAPGVSFMTPPLFQGNNGSFLVKNEGASLQFWPNPADVVLEMLVETPTEQPLEIKLFDLRGKLVHDLKTVSTAGQNQFHFETAALPNGIYLLEIGSASGHEMQKVMVNH